MSTHTTPLGDRAVAILEQMEPDLGYDSSEIRAFAPELNAEALREVMHELWVAREVERCGDDGWRRTRSATNAPRASVESLRVGEVRPEDLFDHDAFAPWFK